MIRLIGTNIILNNFTLSADGTQAINGNAGGSGGSILIHANLFNGNGTISTNGGTGNMAGTYVGGGGAGGRIAIHSSINTFNGSLTSFGGDGPQSSIGGPGTIFLNTAGHKKLIVLGDGSRKQDALPSSIPDIMGSVAWLTDDDGASEFEFDEVSLVDDGSFALKISNRNNSAVSFIK